MSAWLVCALDHFVSSCGFECEWVGETPALGSRTAATTIVAGWREGPPGASTAAGGALDVESGLDGGGGSNDDGRSASSSSSRPVGPGVSRAAAADSAAITSLSVRLEILQ